MTAGELIHLTWRASGWEPLRRFWYETPLRRQQPWRSVGVSHEQHTALSEMKQVPPFFDGVSPRFLLTVAGGALAAIAVVSYIVFPNSSYETDGDRCRAVYRTARTAADTAAVDAQRPRGASLGRAFSARRPTCGELRRLGYVR
jgi:hypothetical protein